MIRFQLDRRSHGTNPRQHVDIGRVVHFTEIHRVDIFDVEGQVFAQPCPFERCVVSNIRQPLLTTNRVSAQIADLSIDPISRDVTRAGRKLALTQKEYALLEYLMRHAGIPVTREQISEQVWKQPFDPTTNIVDVYINYLRKKLETDGAPPIVQTVRGVGYVLRESGTGDT